MKQIKIILLAGLLFLGLAGRPALAIEGQLNINTASASQLQRLPFIGKNRAAAIIRYRRVHGPFKSLRELRRTKAIGVSTFEAVKPYLTISRAGNLKFSSKTSSAGSQLRVMARVNTYPGQVVMLADRAYYDTLRAFINHAHRDIYISMFLFKITKSPRNRAAIILNDLIKARKRHVIVKVLLEKSGYDKDINKDNQRTARRLRKNGIKVRFDTPNTTTHTKIVIIDHRFSFVGSHNFTHSALARNHELSILIDNRQLAGQIINYIKSIH